MGVKDATEAAAKKTAEKNLIENTAEHTEVVGLVHEEGNKQICEDASRMVEPAPEPVANSLAHQEQAARRRKRDTLKQIGQRALQCRPLQCFQRPPAEA